MGFKPDCSDHVQSWPKRESRGTVRRASANLSKQRHQHARYRLYATVLDTTLRLGLEQHYLDHVPLTQRFSGFLSSCDIDSGCLEGEELHRCIVAVMAGTRTKTIPTGSTAWIQNEREQATQFVAQDCEEFSYSVRNELEWLQEHMSEVFTKNHVYVIIVKTADEQRNADWSVAISRMFSKPRASYAIRLHELHESNTF